MILMSCGSCNIRAIYDMTVGSMKQNGRNKILIIDDDFIVRFALKKNLAQSFDVIEADNYNSAMSIFNADPLALIILDINLNDSKSGIDILTEVRKQDSTVPIMVLSNYGDVETIVKCLKLVTCPYNYYHFLS